MNRPWQIWTVFGLSLALVLSAMAWVSYTGLKLDRAESEGRRQAALEENVRLALWRVDSALAPIITQESTRPYFSYTAFYATERAYTRMFSEVKHGEILVPSPLLTFESPYVKLHFQIDPDGKITSPQVPSGNMRSLAESTYCTVDRVSGCGGELAAISQKIKRTELLEALPEPPEQLVQTVMVANTSPPAQNKKESSWGSRANKQEQQRLSQNELESRQQAYQMAASPQQMASNGNLQQMQESEQVSEGTMQSVWFGDDLFLARKVAVNDRIYVQGCWLNWPAVERWLLDSVSDLLPNARLERDSNEQPGRETHRLASLQLRLEPGEFPIQSQESLSPIRMALIAAWACGFLAVLAVAALLWGAISLSERRGAFVSAVTHELRTPLTTFRLYTEMLAEGMVKEEAQRQTYLNTLHAEAERLGHLVENVLAYAGLERGRYGRQMEVLAVEALLERIRERLAARARQAEMDVVFDEPEPGIARHLRADPAAVERILFNLVDNASKYAAASKKRVIHVGACASPEGVILRVRDYGPGIPASETRKLFRPFSKSAREAAHSAPGVGLGLALSRRLARSMGGDLRYFKADPDGARFDLLLPSARPGASA
ncbi:MAG: HAMP domain-containing histidine kinase [Planctomycetes bacterium]|nr:HAMP domain-containing histidine kinase [Planctomycetota bacterium]